MAHKSYEELLQECRVDTFRASGKGGQHVNKTESAVRLTHLPSGIVVTCQEQRSQYRNKQTCLRRLRERLKKLAKKPKKRIPTKVSKSAQEKRLQAKKMRSMLKESRKKPPPEE